MCPGKKKPEQNEKPREQYTDLQSIIPHSAAQMAQSKIYQRLLIGTHNYPKIVKL